MAAVYSSQFLLYEHVVGDSAVEIIPDGELWIVREVDLSYGPTTGDTFALLLNGCPLFVVDTGVTTQLQSWQWRGRIVGIAGQTLQFANTGTVSAYVGGYTLSLP